MKKDTKDNEILKDENGKQVVINNEKDESGEDLVDKKTLKKYRVHWYQKIPYPVRAEFIKYWFFGLNYFLFDMGIGSLDFFRGSTTDMLAYSTLILFLISGFALGVFNDIFVYNILDVIEDYPKEKQPFVIFKSKKIYSLFINIIYGIVVVFLSRYLSGLIALAIDPQLTNVWGWFREPFTCALVMFVVDGAFIGIKNLIVLLVKRIRGVDSAEL